MKLNKPDGAKQASSKNPLKKVFEVYFVKRNKRQEIRKKCPKLENRKKGKPYYLRLDYTITTKNAEVTSLLKVYKTEHREKIVAQV